MLFKYTVLVLVALQSTSLLAKQIPVEVRYERLEHSIGQNLAEKPQLAPEELKENELRLQKLSLAEENHAPEANKNLVKNFDAKVQLSQSELSQAYKHIPVQEEVKSGELREASSLSLRETAQKIIEEGLENLRNNFKPKENEFSPSKQQWDELDRSVNNLIENSKLEESLRQEGGGNFIQGFISSFQNATSNFLQNIQSQTQGNAPGGTSGDNGQQPGGIQGFFAFFTDGVQNIAGNLQQLGQQQQATGSNSTVLGDSGTSPGSGGTGNIFGGIISGIQQVFQGQNSSEGSGQGPQGVFSGAISSISQAVSGIIPSNTPAPATQGDEGSTPSSGPIQQVFENFGNAFNQLIQRPGSTKPPQVAQASDNRNPATEQADPASTEAAAEPAGTTSQAPAAAPEKTEEEKKKP
ncbi:uncharacterized protein LOC115877481 isoform X2 [Sitophilus oryzae]|uniref:Uncharacterized protein LOC115877481 isoform X2 n=1 Tax=Sitophilus oryzae TaxID=7048 RepID=A0A6J2XDV6_SITOR|nr:uncharacterized protein LOC115877481 isoform X2 [Sitophilus oryzae]